MTEVFYEQNFTVTNTILLLVCILSWFQLLHICVSVHSGETEEVPCSVLLFG